MSCSTPCRARLHTAQQACPPGRSANAHGRAQQARKHAGRAPVLDGDADHGVDAGVCALVSAKAHGVIGLQHVQRQRIGLGEHHHWYQAQRVAGARHAPRDLAAVGYQHAARACHAGRNLWARRGILGGRTALLDLTLSARAATRFASASQQRSFLGELQCQAQAHSFALQQPASAQSAWRSASGLPPAGLPSHTVANTVPCQSQSRLGHSCTYHKLFTLHRRAARSHAVSMPSHARGHRASAPPSDAACATPLVCVCVMLQRCGTCRALNKSSGCGRHTVGTQQKAMLG